MSFNIDGFNERSIYIHNSNDRNRLRTNGPSNIDNSFGKMRAEERKNMVETANTDEAQYIEETRGNKDNFIVRNNAMNNINNKPVANNPISQAMFRNRFNQFKK